MNSSNDEVVDSIEDDNQPPYPASYLDSPTRDETNAKYGTPVVHKNEYAQLIVAVAVLAAVLGFIFVVVGLQETGYSFDAASAFAFTLGGWALVAFAALAGLSRLIVGALLWKPPSA